MREAWARLCRVLARGRRETAAAEWDGVPLDDFERLLAWGWLAATAPATTAVCPACDDGHAEAVVRDATPGRPDRWFVPCPAFGRGRIDPRELRRYAPLADAVATRLAAALGAGTPTALAAGVWRLGAFRLGPNHYTGFLALDAAATRAEFDRPDAVVFTPTPTAGGPTRVALTEVAEPDGPELRLDRAALRSLLDPSDDSAQAPGVGLVLPPATRWADLTLTVTDATLSVAWPGGARAWTYAEAGFGDRRGAALKPNRLWGVLSLAARAGGTLATVRSARKPEAVRKTVSELRRALQGLTGLAGDPFHPAEGGVYRLRSRIAFDDAADWGVPAGTDWDEFAVRIAADGTIEVTGPGPGGVTWSKAVTAAGLKLDPRVWAKLAAVARDGRVAGGRTDAAMLVLADALQRFTGLESPPFRHTPDGWRPEFRVLPPRVGA